MKLKCVKAIVILLLIGVAVGLSVHETLAQDAGVHAPSTGEPSAPSIVPPTQTAKQSHQERAKLLHETLHGALLVMHRDFFSEETSRILPSQSLLSVFTELQRSHGVGVRWMTVSGDEMNEAHRPVTPFELEAVRQIKQGAEFHDFFDNDTYRYIGRIRLASECLKCHVSRRTSTEDRASALIITMKTKDNVNGNE